jgi:hypothetical protein
MKSPALHHCAATLARTDNPSSRMVIDLGQEPLAFTLVEAPTRDDLAAERPVAVGGTAEQPTFTVDLGAVKPIAAVRFAVEDPMMTEVCFAAASSTTGILPSNVIGTAIFTSSFFIGFLAFVVTQIGFAKKVRASQPVPAYNAAYIGLPVIWQVFLLPNYRLSWMSDAGILLIIGGVAGMQVFNKQNKRTKEAFTHPTQGD